MRLPNFIISLATLIVVLRAAGPSHAEESGALAKGFQALQRRNAPAAIAAFQPSADAGEKEALYGLGRTYLELGGCPGGKDCQRAAVPLIRRAAIAGEARAAALLGLWYQHGSLDQPEDLAQSLQWYEAAGQGGDQSALIEIGFLCETGGAPCSPDEAAQAYRRAEAVGNPYASFRLGEMHRLGRHAPRDPTLAARHYGVAAERGSAEAQARLADAYLTGDGVIRDERRALTLYERAATGGKAGGFVGLARIYRDGLGAPADRAKALGLLRQALNASEGQDRLGDDFREAKANAALMAAEMCGEDPQAPARRALIHAAARFRDAAAIQETLNDADAGDPNAQAVLGSVYLWSEHAPRDRAAALEWLKRASEQGQVDAMTALAAVYASGLGVAPDQQTAYLWLSIARPRAEGWQRFLVEDKLLVVRRLLTTEQQKEIEARAALWVPRLERSVRRSSPPRGCLVEPPGTRFAWNIAR